MRRLSIFALLLALFIHVPFANADNCQDAIDEYNEAADEDEAWWQESLQSEFGVSQWSDIDFSEARVCERILPIYREQLSRAEHVQSLHQAAAGVCRNLRFSGGGRTPEERIAIIRENIRLCEDSDSDSESSEEASGGEGEEEFKAAQQLAEEQQQQAARETPPPAASTGGYGRSANCSDITGTGGGGSAADCPEPKKREFAAVPVPDNQPRTPAAAQPPVATPQPGMVDRLTGLAGSIIDALGRVRSGQEDSKQKSSTGASLPEDFDPKTFDTYRNDPPELPTEGMPCRHYFLRMLEAFHQNARLCIRDTRLLQGIEQMVQKPIEDITEDDKLVTRKTPPNLYAYFAEKDPRWKDMGDHFEPQCDVGFHSGRIIQGVRAGLSLRRARGGMRPQKIEGDEDEGLPSDLAGLPRGKSDPATHAGQSFAAAIPAAELATVAAQGATGLAKHDHRTFRTGRERRFGRRDSGAIDRRAFVIRRRGISV